MLIVTWFSDSYRTLKIIRLGGGRTLSLLENICLDESLETFGCRRMEIARAKSTGVIFRRRQNLGMSNASLPLFELRLETCWSRPKQLSRNTSIVAQMGSAIAAFLHTRNVAGWPIGKYERDQGARRNWICRVEIKIVNWYNCICARSRKYRFSNDLYL